MRCDLLWNRKRTVISQCLAFYPNRFVRMMLSNDINCMSPRFSILGLHVMFEFGHVDSG
jgi:hypothetical protein